MKTYSVTFWEFLFTRLSIIAADGGFVHEETKADHLAIWHPNGITHLATTFRVVSARDWMWHEMQGKLGDEQHAGRNVHNRRKPNV